LVSRHLRAEVQTDLVSVEARLRTLLCVKG
jgi:hypothetical protein